MANKRKKVNKYRGHTTHGGGHRKKRRGAGSRGGRGRAGSGKRAGHKKAGGVVISGSKGFLPRRSFKSIKTVNVSFFTEHRLNNLLSGGKVEKDGDLFVINLKNIGFNKLLGSGSCSSKIKVEAESFSRLAKEKVQQAGGLIVESGVESEPAKSEQAKSEKNQRSNDQEE